MHRFIILCMFVLAHTMSTSFAAPKVNLPLHSKQNNMGNKQTKEREPSAPQVLTKESVDALLNSISPQCKAEMEGGE